MHIRRDGRRAGQRRKEVRRDGEVERMAVEETDNRDAGAIFSIVRAVPASIRVPATLVDSAGIGRGRRGNGSQTGASDCLSQRCRRPRDGHSVVLSGGHYGRVSQKHVLLDVLAYRLRHCRRMPLG